MKNKMLIPYTFVLMNWAAVLGLYHFLRHGKSVHHDIWAAQVHSHVRSETRNPERTGPRQMRPAA